MSDAKLDHARLENVKTHGDKTTARCPACAETGADKKGDNLAIFADGKFACIKYQATEGEAHRQRIFAIAGTGASATRATQSKPNDAALKPATPTGPACPDAAAVFAGLAHKAGKLIARWEYRDAAGQVVFEIARFEHSQDGKTYRPARRDPDGWRCGFPVGPLPLYGLPELLTTEPGKTVFVTEGEKCADAVRALGAIATCSSGGASAAVKTDWTPLAGREVVILPDNDAPGAKYAAAVAAILNHLNPPAKVRIATLPGIEARGEGADVVNWLDERDAQEPSELLAAIAAAPATEAAPTEPETEGGGLSIVDAASYIETEPPAHDPIIEELFEAGDKVGVIASAKRKKTWFVKQLAICCATGRAFLGWAIPKARRVLIIQAEIKEAHYHRRVRFTARAMGVTVADLGGRLGVVNARGTGIDAQQIKTLALRWRAELVIVDPLYKFTTGDENKAQDVKPLLAVFDEIATETGAAVLWVHHDCKGTPGDRDARDRGAGSNILIRDVDQLFTLSPHRDDPDATVVETLARNYKDEGRKTIRWTEGAFEVDGTTPAIVRTSANGSQYSEALQRLDATEPGLSLAAAAARLGCDRSTVSRLRKQWGVA
jgi:hypothetical protein